MFSYLTPVPELLTPEQNARCHALHCGLCHTLGERYGQRARLSLTCDLTFLVVLLNSLRGTAGGSGGFTRVGAPTKARCILHPSAEHEIVRCGCQKYVADLSVAMAYHVHSLEWRRTRKRSSFACMHLLKPAYEDARDYRGKQCRAIERTVDALTDLVKQGAPLESQANCLGSLMGRLLANEDDPHGDLYRFGFDLGCYEYAREVVQTGTEEQRLMAAALLEDYRAALEKSFKYLSLDEDAELVATILFQGKVQPAVSDHSAILYETDELIGYSAQAL